MQKWEGRLALLGWSPELLTLGLLAARRDIDMSGLCPAGRPLPADQLDAPLSTALFSTLLLGCPVLERPAELADCTLLISASELDLQMLPAEMRGKSAFLRFCATDCANNAKATNASSNTISIDETVATNGADLLTLYAKAPGRPLEFCCASKNIKEQVAQLWECLSASSAHESDGGLLNWEQAAALVQKLYDSKALK